MTNITGKVKEYGVIAGYSLAGATVMTYFSCTSCSHDYKKFILTALFSAIMWAVMWIGNGELAHFLSSKFPWVKAPIKRLLWGLLSTVMFTVAVAFLLMKSWEYSRGFRFTNYTSFILISLVITFLISLFMHGREFLIEWRRSAVAAERYQKESMQATYESLKSQVNPHFLFNSLNALTNLVYEDQDKAAKFIKQLSEVYRYVLDTRDKEVVTLSEELKFLDSYAYLQRIRFGDKLRISISIQNELFRVAPLALQMLLENAVKHNEVSEENPLEINVYQQGDAMYVENSLRKRMRLGDDSSGMGLENIRKRYQFLTDRSVVVKETSSQFSVCIPLLPMT